MGEPQPNRHDCGHVHALAALLADDAIDAAIEAGLMEVQADLHCIDCGDDARRVISEQQRLHSNWSARERYRTRTARLQRRAAERQAKRMPVPPPAAHTVAATALPPAVAAALARAKARAAERSS